MGIAVNKTAYNGTELRYAKLGGITIDLAQNTAEVALIGYASQEHRQAGHQGYEILKTTVQMPEQHPEYLSPFFYGALAEMNPDMDFSEI